MINSYKDLEVWKKGIELAYHTYKITSVFPSFEIYAITSQIRRASTSIPANIAEGYGRETTPSFVSFLRISKGSLYELESHLIMAEKLNYLDSGKLNDIQEEIEVLGKMLNTLIRKLNQRITNH
jgi:four helix bundle protein